jgi:hypothetical protein
MSGRFLRPVSFSNLAQLVEEQITIMTKAKAKTVKEATYARGEWQFLQMIKTKILRNDNTSYPILH